MADGFLDAHPGLRPYVLSNLQLTGTVIGGGAYGSVEEVTVPFCGAAKRVHDLLMNYSKISTQFAEELQLMSALHHPNIVQFLGVYFFPDSRLPALVMERLLTSLHDLLDPETDDAQPPPAQPPPAEPTPLSFFTLGLKCSILHNVASGLAYLHGRTPPIIHRDLSAKNVLLTSQLVAKLADLGVARIVPDMRVAATMTKAPGASVYMPPEAIAPAESNDEKAKYDASIDIFSFGVVTIFTVGEIFPCDPLAATYSNKETGNLIARTELQRRGRYMQNVSTQLRACGQFREDHPLIRLIQQCLHNDADKRPNIGVVLNLLEETRASIRDENNERNRAELVRALQNQPRNQNLVQVMDDLVTENAELQKQLTRKEAEITRAEEQQQMKQLEVAELQQQLQSNEREKEMFRQQLTRKETELTRAEETIRREQQQMRQHEVTELQQQLQSSEGEKRVLRQQLARKEAELTTAEETFKSEQQQMRQLEIKKDRELAQTQQQLKQQETERDEIVQAKDRELVEAQQQLRQQEESSRREIGDLKRQLQSSESLVADFQKTLQQRDSEQSQKHLVLPPPHTKKLHTSSTFQSALQSSPQAPEPVTISNSIPPSKQGKLTVRCHKKKSAKWRMERGSATTDDKFAYFTPRGSYSVFRYEWSTEKWKKLPRSPYEDYGLVIIDGEPTAVGGWDGFHFTNKLFTLQQGQWVEHYPAMKTLRSFPAVVRTSDGNYILVIGGSVNENSWTSTVELFHVRSRRWYKLTNLPQALTEPSAAIYGNELHVIGHDGAGYSCSLQALLSSDHPMISQLVSNILTWTPLPQQPVDHSTAATLCGELVVVGGKRGESSVNSIHQLIDGQWVAIDSMSCDRWMCFVVSPSPDKMMIVGGYGGYLTLDSVEECVVV